MKFNWLNLNFLRTFAEATLWVDKLLNLAEVLGKGAAANELDVLVAKQVRDGCEGLHIVTAVGRRLRIVEHVVVHDREVDSTLDWLDRSAIVLKLSVPPSELGCELLVQGGPCAFGKHDCLYIVAKPRILAVFNQRPDERHLVNAWTLRALIVENLASLGHSLLAVGAHQGVEVFERRFLLGEVFASILEIAGGRVI